MKPLNIVVATDLNDAIGKEGLIPWRSKSDMANFKKITSQGHNPTVIMGMVTAQSLGRALPNRRNIVISRRNDEAPYVHMELTHSFADALALCGPEDDVYIIGGESIYRLALDYVGRPKRIYHTTLEVVVNDPDRFMPAYEHRKFTHQNVERRFDATANELAWTLTVTHLD